MSIGRETPPRGARPGRFAVLRPARATAITSLAVIVLGLIGGWALLDHQLRPGSGSATPGASSSAKSLVLPPALARLTQVVAQEKRVGSLADAAWGQQSYTIDWTSTATVNISGSWTGSADVPLTQTEIEAHRTKGASGTSVTADGQDLAVVVWHSVGQIGEPRVPCPDVVALPRAWRILVALLDSSGKPGPLTEFATGDSATVFSGPMGGEGCPATSAPRVSVSDGMIAYAIDDPTSRRPYGTRILVRSLSTGAITRDLSTPTRVLSLQLAGTTVAWLEADGDWPMAIPLRIWADGTPDPQNVEVFATPGDQMSWSLPRFSLTKGAVAWERFGTGQIWVRDPSERQASPTAATCLLGGIEAGVVAMNCGGDSSKLQQNEADAPWLVLWSTDSHPRLVVGLPPLATEELSGGWVVIEPTARTSTQAFPLDSLRAP